MHQSWYLMYSLSSMSRGGRVDKLRNIFVVRIMGVVGKITLPCAQFGKTYFEMKF